MSAFARAANFSRTLSDKSRPGGATSSFFDAGMIPEHHSQHDLAAGPGPAPGGAPGAPARTVSGGAGGASLQTGGGRRMLLSSLSMPVRGAARAAAAAEGITAAVYEDGEGGGEGLEICVLCVLCSLRVCRCPGRVCCNMLPARLGKTS
jgi:hypothetical protein